MRPCGDSLLSEIIMTINVLGFHFVFTIYMFLIRGRGEPVSSLSQLQINICAARFRTYAECI